MEALFLTCFVNTKLSNPSSTARNLKGPVSTPWQAPPGSPADLPHSTSLARGCSKRCSNDPSLSLSPAGCLRGIRTARHIINLKVLHTQVRGETEVG